ncbi:Crp/Fnr family transcriptional regulator [Algibacter pacificus]|uniref:Crp/Fnr family transcriptional regulator n=1 Tax=Algibacter pacificus TaxID=2599389 RepID=UPI0011C8809A|nr:Crp/Fnr family transcriptional regulator [Algibacter pacificus]
MITELRDSYGHVFEEKLLEEISKIGVYKEIPEGFKLLEIGDYIKSMPLLMSGAIKILREDHDGDELLLYYLERGETCSMTMTCCLGHKQSEIRAVAETDTKLIMVPVGKMEDWTSKYESWRNFVLESYHNRINELLTTLDGIAFFQLDERLVQYLKKKAEINNDNIIKYTHQEIAYDLHTSRVVISRLLKKLEQLGKIELHRNYLKLIKL